MFGRKRWKLGDESFGVDGRDIRLRKIRRGNNIIRVRLVKLFIATDW
jgi:hypothetical protein